MDVALKVFHFTDIFWKLAEGHNNGQWAGAHDLWGKTRGTEIA